METPKDQTQDPQKPAMASSCRRKVKDDATFFEDVKDHIDEFIHASMDEHKTCFQKTISKVLFPKSNLNTYDYIYVIDY